jgi:RIO kinase 1
MKTPAGLQPLIDDNIRNTLGRFAPELLETEFAQEMWSLFEQGELKTESGLTGLFARDEAPADTENVLAVIDDAREEAMRREWVAES